MDVISHQLSKCEDLEHCHMTHDFLRNFVTYLGLYEKNKMMVKFNRGKKTASNKGTMSRIVSRSATSTKDISQIFLSNELTVLFKIYVQEKITQDKTK